MVRPAMRKVALSGALAMLVVALSALVGIVGTPGIGASGALATHAAAAAPRTASSTGITPGLHDTAINDCDDHGTPGTTADPTKAVASFSNSYWPGSVRTVRVTIPWDIAAGNNPTLAGQLGLSPTDVASLNVTRTCFDAWLGAAFQHGLQPEIDLRVDNYFVDASNKVMAPTLSNYESGVTWFRDSYVDCGLAGRQACVPGAGQVTAISPWNEPEVGNVYLQDPATGKAGQTRLAGADCPPNANQTNCGAAMAAQMWTVVQHRVVMGLGGGVACSACVDIAGNFGAADGLEKGLTRGKPGCPSPVPQPPAPLGCAYLDIYNYYLRDIAGGNQVYHPAVWAVHPYTDVGDYEKVAATTPPGQGAAPKFGRFTEHLKALGYGPSTSIWINEISAFNGHAPYNPQGFPQWNQAAQTKGMQYLLATMPARAASGGPAVRRIDYFCFNEGNQCDPAYALLVGGAPIPAYSVYTQWAS